MDQFCSAPAPGCCAWRNHFEGMDIIPRGGQVGEGDFFWEANGRNQFPKVAEDVDVQLRQYKQARARSARRPCQGRCQGRCLCH
jgi:hypothetical protein